MKKYALFYFLLFQIGSITVCCQGSGHPSSVVWKHIESPYFNIIYPDGRYGDAKRIGEIISLMNQDPRFNNQHKNRKIDLILQTRQVIANGYVGIGPYRSEFYATPLQNSYLSTNTDWLDVLAVHEYKHVHQLNDTRVGLTRLASYLLGQGGWAGLKFLAMPDWYAEGDAISGETWLTSGGRGRSPQFTARQKSLLMEGKKFRYSQMRGGSFRYELPNHYVLGHILHEYVRQNYGADTWNKVINTAARYRKGPFYNFSLSLKKETGLKTRGLYKKAYEDFKTNAGKSYLLDLRSDSEVKPITKTSKTPTYYEFPVIDKNNTYALKSTFKDLPSIIKIDKSGKEKKISPVGINTEEYLGFRDSIFAWCEYARDPRWAFENFSDIYTLDLKTGVKKQLTHEGKYFSPDPNRHLSQITAVKMDTSLISQLVFIDMVTGKEKAKTTNSLNGFISYPKWVSDTEVVYILRAENKASIYKYDLTKEDHTQMTIPTSHLINHLSVHKREVYFTATFDGSDQIYAVNIDSKEVMKYSNDPIGAYTPVSDDTSITYHTIVSKGTQLKQLPKSSGQSFTITERKDIAQDVNITTVEQEHKNYTEKPYKRSGRLQLHSYAPSQDLNRPGIQLYFENALSNIEGIAEVYYNLNEKAFQTTTSVSFSARYPVFTLGISPVSRASFAFVSDSNKVLRYTFNEFNYGGSVSVPLRWIDGNMVRAFRPSAGINYKHIYNQQEKVSPKDLSSFTNLSLGLSMSNLRRIATQNFGTRWGQEFSLAYRSSLYGPEGSALQMRGNIYLPGIFKNHRIKLGGEYYREIFLNTYKFSNNFQYARGGTALPYDAARRFSAEYGLTLLYPDMGILDITYFKRIRLNLFGDITSMKLPRGTLHANSFGGEFLFDNIWLNSFPVTMGVRLSYIDEVDEVKFKPEFLFAVDL